MKVMDRLKKNKLILSKSKAGNKDERVCCSCQMAKACHLRFLIPDESYDEPFGFFFFLLGGGLFHLINISSNMLYLLMFALALRCIFH